MKKKTVWILNHYATSMIYDKGGRHYWFAKYLKKSGYEPVIFCANIFHSESDKEVVSVDLYKELRDEEYDIPFVFVKTTPYQGNGKSRIKNMLSFYKNVIKAGRCYARENDVPDVIIGSSVHPLAIMAAYKLSRHFNIECIGEIRDLWPESLVEYGFINRNSNLHRILLRGEKWLYTKCDKLIFTVEGAIDYLKEQGWGLIFEKKFNHINNGVDLEAFEKNIENYQIKNDKDLNRKDLFKVIYTGSLRKVNKVIELVNVAEMLKHKGYDKIKILVFGSGDQAEEIEKEIETKQLDNIVLKGRVNKQYVPYVLSKSDLNIYLFEKTNLSRFGLSLNKSFEYFASGKPVLTSSNSGYSIVDRYGCGRCLEEYSPDKMADEIISFYNMDYKEYECFCKGAREAALHYDFANLTRELIQIIEK